MPAEALEQVLAHPDLAPEEVVALLRHPNTPGAAMAALAARASGGILDVLLSVPGAPRALGGRPGGPPR